jgi:DNA-3-methyladenine glycosylase II
MSFKPEQVAEAIRHLQRVDPVMKRLLAEAGAFKLKLNRHRFQMLVRSIVSQQISTKAARAIQRKLDESLGLPKSASGPVMAQAIADQTDEQLRAAGLSGQKVSYLRDLAERTLDGRLKLDRIGRLSDEEAIEHLVQVKGIGRWTAQMFLMFSLGRLDVFPHDDFGVRSAIRDLYGLSDLPDKRQSHEIAQPWEPFRSVASWYCWRSIDLMRKEKE